MLPYLLIRLKSNILEYTSPGSGSIHMNHSFIWTILHLPAGICPAEVRCSHYEDSPEIPIQNQWKDFRLPEPASGGAWHSSLLVLLSSAAGDSCLKVGRAGCFTSSVVCSSCHIRLLFFCVEEEGRTYSAKSVNIAQTNLNVSSSLQKKKNLPSYFLVFLCSLKLTSGFISF